MKGYTGRCLTETVIFGPEMLEDPYPVYDQLRQENPVYRDGNLQAWILTRYHEVAAVLNDKRFSANRIALGRERHSQPDLDPLFDFLSLLMMEQDDPDHKRLRGFVGLIP
jgi:cytochrome P450